MNKQNCIECHRKGLILHGCCDMDYKSLPEEMIKLRQMLDDMGIEWQDMSTTLIMDDLVKNLTPIDLSMIRTHFSYNGVRISVICGYGSYGGKKGLLEMWNGQDEPEGYLTAEDVIKTLKGERE